VDKIIDIALVVIFLICIWSGYKKGLIMGIGGIIVIIISLFGANLLSNTFSYEVIPAMRPFASGYMEKKINEDVTESLGFAESDYSVEDILAAQPDITDDFCVQCFESVGIYGRTAERMAEEAVAYAEEQDVDTVTAVVEVLCKDVAFAAGFILAFLIIVIVLTVIGNLPNLSFKIPHMDLLNDIGGAVLGLVTAFLFATVIVWALKFAGMLIGADTLDSTLLAKGLAKMDLLGRILGL
jgi:hypothetical protein